jgi:hypothetical protein
MFSSIDPRAPTIYLKRVLWEVFMDGIWADTKPLFATWDMNDFRIISGPHNSRDSCSNGRDGPEAALPNPAWHRK